MEKYKQGKLYECKLHYKGSTWMMNDIRKIFKNYSTFMQMQNSENL